MQVCEGWGNFLNELEGTKLSVVCFGAGAIPWLAEPLFEKYEVWSRIIFFLDNNEKKTGTSIGIKRKIPVISPKQFMERGYERFLMLITCEDYIPILEQLKQADVWRDIHCYIYIKLNYELLKNKKQTWTFAPEGQHLIPKVIHYCWFGNCRKGKLHQRCIQSWRDNCPDYEIIEWNENNYDIHKNRYMEEAYAKRKWAYVSDYARLDILYRHGGIYLDADVELLNRLDVLLSEKGFIAYGQWPSVNSGAGMGCVKGLPIVEEMRDKPRSRIPFLNQDGSLNMVQNGFYESGVLRRYGFLQDFSMQRLKDLLVLAPEIMATESLLGEDVFVTEHTLAIHHCAGSWKA